MAVDIAKNEAPPDEPQGERGGRKRDRREQQHDISVAGVVPDLLQVDAMEYPGKQRDADGEPDEPGSPPPTCATRVRWRGQRGRRLRR